MHRVEPTSFQQERWLATNRGALATNKVEGTQSERSRYVLDQTPTVK